jgi:hypothetical protein
MYIQSFTLCQEVVEGYHATLEFGGLELEVRWGMITGEIASNHGL